MAVIRYKDIAYGGGSSVTEGYYKVADGKFYEHFDGTTYSDEITGEDGILYLDLSTNNLYRWSTGASLFVLVGKSTLASLNDTNISSPTDGQAIEYNGTSSKWVNVAKKAADTPTFTEATGTRSNIVGSGETMATILGKIKRWFTDLKDLAFIGKDGTSSTKYLRGDGTWQEFPTIPTVNDKTLTIQKNGTQVAQFTANSASDVTANITVPTGDLASVNKPSSGQTTSYLRGDGTWQNFPTIPAAQVNSDWNATSGVAEILNKPTIPDDTKVTQTNTTGDASYRVLFSKNANDTTETDTARKNTGLQYNPSKRTLTTNTVKNDVSNHLLTGTGTAGQDKGSGQTNRYVPSVWTFNLRNAPADGDEISIKIPVAGISYGVWLSVDNGTTYYPVGRNDTSRLQTQFANGTTIHLVFQTNANMSMYARGGADSSTTYTGNYWKVVNYYDSNTTYSVVSTSANGLAPKVTDTSKFLKGDGTWAAPTDNTKLPLAGGTMTGTINSQSIVPKTDETYYLGDNSHQYRACYSQDFIAGRSYYTDGLVSFANATNGYLTGLRSITTSGSNKLLYLPNENGILATQAWATQEINLDGTMTFTNTSYSGGSTTRSYAARAIRGTRMVWLIGGAGNMNFSAFPTSNAFSKIASGLPKAKYTVQFWMIGMRTTTAGCVFQIDGNGDLSCNVAGVSSRVNDWCWFNYWYLAADSYF